jgi:hypothetical protein
MNSFIGGLSVVIIRLPDALARLSKRTLKPKDFKNITFLHTPGTSYQKNTREILLCWRDYPEFPLLRIFSINKWVKENYDEIFKGKNVSNIELQLKDLSSSEFGKLLAEANVILCPSRMEGFGHYINQARASGSLIITTDSPPMNEFIDESSGILVKVDKYAKNPNHLLAPGFAGEHGLRNVNPIEAIVSPKRICEAVYHVVNRMTPQERAKKAAKARIRYEEDVVFFRKRMLTLRKLTKELVNSFHRI